MEILSGNIHGILPGNYHLAPGAASRVDDCALKLVFFVSAILTVYLVLTLQPLYHATHPYHTRHTLTTRDTP